MKVDCVPSTPGFDSRYYHKYFKGTFHSSGQETVMRRSSSLVALVALAVALLPAFLCQETSKRHISESEEDNLTSRKVGPALRPFTVQPVFHRLKAEVVGEVVVGEDVSLKVSLRDEQGAIKTCHWTSPDEAPFNVEKESVTSTSGTDPSRKCSLLHTKDSHSCFVISRFSKTNRPH